VDGFVAHVASFRKIDVIDIRPLPDDIPNVYFKQANMMEKLPFELEECCDSVSCLHALEHFGLGRYGDPVDPTGWKKGFNNLSAMLQVGGRLYLSVPVGPSRVEFNSHRVFSVPLLISLFKDEFEIEQMALIDDEGYLHAPFDWEKAVARESSEVKNGCGVVIAIKRQLKK
jgi:SAM-dependent methyltransferase